MNRSGDYWQKQYKITLARKSIIYKQRINHWSKFSEALHRITQRFGIKNFFEQNFMQGKQ